MWTTGLIAVLALVLLLAAVVWLAERQLPTGDFPYWRGQPASIELE